jgi:hypothetical protein
LTRWLERYGKGPNDSEKYREAMSIATELKSLERAFMALPNEGILPKETLLISAIKGLLQQSSHVTLVGHLLPSHFEESLSTLQYVERCKAEVVGGDRGSNVESLGATSSDQLLRNLKQVNEEYKKEIEATERKQDAQFDRIKSVLGLNIDLKTMMQRGPTAKDTVVIENHRQAQERVANFQERNRELEAKLGKVRQSIKKAEQRIEEKGQYFKKLLDDMNKQLNGLMAKSNQVKAEYNNIPNEMSPLIEEERKKVAEVQDREVEQKLDILFRAQGVIDHHNEAMIEATRMCENSKREVEGKYREEMRNFRKLKDEQLANLGKQYDFHISKKKVDLQEFMDQAEHYCKKKKLHVTSLRDELHRLEAIVHHQSLLIDKAENGSYTGGIKSLNIPKVDKVMRLSSTQNNL